MSRGLVNLEELRKKIDKANFRGDTAYCFVIGDEIIKVYARRNDRGFHNFLNPKEICDFSKYQADTIVFPKEYIYENGEKSAEIMRFIT